MAPPFVGSYCSAKGGLHAVHGSSASVRLLHCALYGPGAVESLASAESVALGLSERVIPVEGPCPAGSQ